MNAKPIKEAQKLGMMKMIIQEDPDQSSLLEETSHPSGIGFTFNKQGEKRPQASVLKSGLTGTFFNNQGEDLIEEIKTEDLHSSSSLLKKVKYSKRYDQQSRNETNNAEDRTSSANLSSQPKKRDGIFSITKRLFGGKQAPKMSSGKTQRILEDDQDTSTIRSPTNQNVRSSRSEYLSFNDLKSSKVRGQEYPKTELSHHSGQSKSRRVKQLIIMDDLTVIEVESNRVTRNNRISANTANDFDIKGDKINVNKMFEGYLM